MKSVFNKLILILFALLCSTCSENKEPSLGGDYSESYKYFPYNDGSKWTYEYVATNWSWKDTVQNGRIVSIRNNKERRFEHYLDGKLKSYLLWNNIDHQIICCAGSVLLDYGRINCSGNMALIDISKNTRGIKKVHQYCEKQYATMVENYHNVPCIKTIETTEFTNGTVLKIAHFFGYEVGLVYRFDTMYDIRDSTVYTKEWKLTSHQL